MKFLIDANLGRKFTNLTNKAGYDAVFINDLLTKASDEDILILAERENRIVITNDKDFGELIFKSKKASSGVILLRLKNDTSSARQKYVHYLIKNFPDRLKSSFIVIEEKQIRIRKLR